MAKDLRGDELALLESFGIEYRSLVSEGDFRRLEEDADDHFDTVPVSDVLPQLQVAKSKA
jgi:hypothetical protein